MKKICLLFLLANILNITAYADDNKKWDSIREKGLLPGTSYNISSGTGFFVAPGYVVTNQHVVNDCLNIGIRGAVPPSVATIFAFDQQLDLAILKTDSISPDIAYLRSDNLLNQYDNLYLAGYPLEHSVNSTLVIKPVRLLRGTAEELEFSTGIEHGNSGGPLLDSEGKVVGVAQAKKNYYQNDYYSDLTKETPIAINGLAISLKILEEFLNSYSINYRLGQSSNLFVFSSQAMNSAQDYIVNIHCTIN